MLEKLTKKLKPFHDEKVKPKQRFLSLNTFLESSTSEEQARFIKENDQQTFTVVLEAFLNRKEKIKAKGDKSMSYSGKEVQLLLKIIGVMKKIIVFNSEKIRQGWLNQSIVSVIQTLSVSQNHPKLRLEGFKLLLLWVNQIDVKDDSVSSFKDKIDSLFASAIILDVFEPFALPLPVEGSKDELLHELSQQTNEPWVGTGKGTLNIATASENYVKRDSATDQGTPLLPNGALPNTNDSIELIDELLCTLISLSNANSDASPKKYPSMTNFPQQQQSSASSLPQPKLSSQNISVGAITNSTDDSSLSNSKSSSYSGINSSPAQTAAQLWGLFKKHYLRLLFPMTARRYNMAVANGEGFATCPSEILHLLINFYVRNCMESVTTPSSSGGFPGTTSSATFIQNVLMGTELGHEFYHEALRQSLLLPYINGETTRGAIHIIRSWISVPREERPFFLQDQTSMPLADDAVLESPSTAGATTASPALTSIIVHKVATSTVTNVGEAIMNASLRRYIKMLRLVFFDKKDHSDNVNPQIENATWEVMLECILQLQFQVMCAPSNKYAIISIPSAADECVDFIMETLFHCWVRSQTKSDGLWLKLRQQLNKSTRWPQTVSQWGKLLVKLTKVLSQVVYGVELDGTKNPPEGSPTKRPIPGSSNKPQHSLSRHPSTSRQQSLNINFVGSNSDMQVDKLALSDGAILFSKMNKLEYEATSTTSGSNKTVSKDEVSPDSPKKVDVPAMMQLIQGIKESVMQERSNNDSTSTLDYSANPHLIPIVYSLNPKVAEFTNLGLINWNVDLILFMWKNTLCTLGNVNNIPAKQAAIHADAINILVNIWDNLEKIRTLQPNECNTVPPLFEFATWIFEAADLPQEFLDGKAMAYGCMCKMMCRKHDQPVPMDLYPHFYRLLTKGLCSEQFKIHVAILLNCTKIFTLCLPGYHIIIPPFIHQIPKLFLTSSSASLYPTIVRQHAISILSSLPCIINLCARVENYGELPTLPTIQSPVKTNLVILSELAEDLPWLNGNDVVTEGEQKETSNVEQTKSSGTVPYLKYTHGQGLKISSITFHRLKQDLKDAYLAMLSEDRSRLEQNEETHGQLICAIGIMAFDEMISNPSPQKEIVEDCVNALLDHLNSASLKIINYTTGALNLIAQNIRSLTYMEKTMVQGVVQKMIGALTEHICLPMTTSENRGQIVSRLFFCLLEWVMISPDDLIRNQSISHMIFDVIENALSDSPNAVTSNDSGEAEEKSSPGKKKAATITVMEATPKKNTGDRKSHFFGKENTEKHLDSQTALSNEPAELVEDNLIKESAEHVLEHILHHVNNFAPTAGGAQVSSNIVDPAFDDEKDKGENYLYFTFNDTTLITIIEFPSIESPHASKTRIITRDITGKYSWDSQIFYESFQKMKKEQKTSRSPNVLLNDERAEPAASLDSNFDLTTYVGFADEFQFYAPFDNNGNVSATDHEIAIQVKGSQDSNLNAEVNTSISDVDKLDKYLQMVGRLFPDRLLHDKKPLNVPSLTLSEETRHQMNNVGEYLDDVVRQEYTHLNGLIKSGNIQIITQSQLALNELGKDGGDNGIPGEEEKPVIRAMRTTQSFSREQPGLPTGNFPQFQRSRLLLSHLGFLNFNGLKKSNLHLLAKSPALYRDIKGLDKKFGREVMKVAIIYVAKGQEDEVSILKNEKGSTEYELFVKSLGWEIDIGGHQGYLGGLEKNLATGKNAIYYCTSTLEMIFHDIIKIPKDMNDEKQVKRKRHIGNDHVHIVWNENNRDYKRNTIGGDFGNAQVVVTPLVNGLYAIDLIRDHQVPTFGPLQNRMVVSRNSLGPLVRMTAIHAYRAALVVAQGGTGVAASAGAGAATASTSAPLAGSGGGVGGGNGPSSLGRPNLSHPTNSTSKSIVSSLYKPSYSQRAADIRVITSRHKMSQWTYERFMESVFFSGGEGVNKEMD